MAKLRFNTHISVSILLVFAFLIGIAAWSVREYTRWSNLEDALKMRIEIVKAERHLHRKRLDLVNTLIRAQDDKSPTQIARLVARANAAEKSSKHYAEAYHLYNQTRFWELLGLDQDAVPIEFPDPDEEIIATDTIVKHVRTYVDSIRSK